MIVEPRSVPGCRNLEPVRQTLYSALTELGLAPHVIEVVGAFPSPSVLVNSVDVKRASGGGGPACQLDLPTAKDLRPALQQALAAESPAGPGSVAGRSADCCGLPCNAIRVDRPRRAVQLPAGLRPVHQAILRHFAATGHAPDWIDVDAAARREPIDVAVRELAAEDLVALDATAGWSPPIRSRRRPLPTWCGLAR